MHACTRFNSLQRDILAVLMQISEKRLQRRDLRNAVFLRYERRYVLDTFDVILQRALNRLIDFGYLKKDKVSHKQVYYYIPKRRQKEIAERLETETALRVLEDILDALPPEQRRKEIEALRRKAEQIEKDLDFYKWKDNLASIQRQAERFGPVGQNGYLHTNRKFYFEKVQWTLRELEKLIEKGKEKRWNIDYAVTTTEERLKSILKKRRSGDY